MAHFEPLGMFHPVNRWAVARNRWLILFHKIWSLLNLVKHTSKFFWNSKDSKSALIYYIALVVVDLILKFVLFHYIKIVKHIWEPCCHLAAEKGSWYVPKPTNPRMKFHFHLPKRPLPGLIHKVLYHITFSSIIYMVVYLLQ